MIFLSPQFYLNKTKQVLIIASLKYFFLTAVFLLISCSSNKPAFRVGVAPDLPPVIFKRVTTVTGMETDFARELGKELKKPVEFVEMEREKLVPSLEKGDIDIIMSGMNIDDENIRKVAFTMPFYSVGTMLLFRRRDANIFRRTAGSYAIDTDMKIGVFRGSRGEKMARQYMKKFNLKIFDEDDQAVHQLRRGIIDCYLRDSSQTWSIANSRDNQLTGIYWLFSEEKTAWAVNRKDLLLRKKINIILDKWRHNGTTEKIIRKWIPYQKSF